VKKQHYTAIILAGGLSGRIPQFKQLLQLGDSTVVEHTIG